MYYNNYLMNVKTLMNAECVENEKNGFLGTDITYCGHTFNCCVDGYNVTMQYGNVTLRKVPKNIFTIAKKESTNIKHAEEIKNYMKKLLAFTGNYQAAADLK